MASLTQGALAAMIDHTLLKAEATQIELERLCQEAIQYGFATVCVTPYRINLCANLLAKSEVKVSTVIGFPLGASASPVKAMEVIKALADGAREFDMMMNVGALKDRNYGDVEGDIRAVVKAAQGHVVKVILETCLLDDTEIVRACQSCMAAGAQMVKTSTGFAHGGATVEHVALMRQTVGSQLGVKASGGIRDYPTFKSMVAAGASRIGTSAGVNLMTTGLAFERGKY